LLACSLVRTLAARQIKLLQAERFFYRQQQLVWK